MRLPERMPRLPPGVVARVWRGVRMPRLVVRSLPAPPAVDLEVPVPPLEGHPGAWFVRAPDGSELPIRSDDPETLTAAAIRLLEPR